MSAIFGEKLKITLFGQSHSPAIGVVIDGFPAGFKVDINKVQAFVDRRAPGGEFATKRAEKDKVEFVSGLNERGETCGAPICALIFNNDVRSSDYDNIRLLPRPSHCDYSAFVKYGESRDVRGGGQFSGRITAGLVIAGALCMLYLNEKGIKVGAHLSSIGSICDDKYDLVNQIIEQNQLDFPVISSQKAEQMKQEIERVRNSLDSIGATIECKVVGVPAGLGEPPFDGVENRLAQIMFSIPGVKGFEFGNGFSASTLCGSQNNDAFTVFNDKIVTKTNNAGGVNGGITNGMPLIFKVAIKPTPSIAKPQNSVNLNTLKEETLEIKGRHDPCIGVRAVPVVQACTAIVLMDMII